MKRVISIILSIVFVVSLAACGSKDIVNTDNGGELTDAATSAEMKTDSTQNGKILVVYYSATGSTKAVAETLAETLHADIFEIVPQNPYTDDDLNWNDEKSRVSMEHNDESRRSVPLTKDTPDHWEQYDTVYIGYPIWWGIAAWPVDGFVTANDFTGKTVIPFCTSASSGLGNSGELLKDATGTGNWLEGKRFSSNASKEEITEWIK